MIIKDVTIYICQHCKRKMLRKYSMEQHEKWCMSNPDNFKACSGCANLEEITIDHEMSEFDTEYPHKTSSKAFKCKVLDQLLYPTKVEKKGLLTKYPGTFKNQLPMPKTCEHKKDMYEVLDEYFV